jgi:protein SCO1/2
VSIRLTCLLACGAALAAVATRSPAHEHEAHDAAGGYARSLAPYEIPDVTLVASDGRAVALRDVLGGEGPVLMNFIFTTCTSICPVMSAAFAQLPEQLGSDAHELQRVSITIDPEHDTPARLRDYVRRYGASPRWLFLTGDRAAIQRVQRAFDADRGAKSNHVPLTFLHRKAAPSWVRIDGFASAADLVRELRRVPIE